MSKILSALRGRFRSIPRPGSSVGIEPDRLAEATRAFQSSGDSFIYADVGSAGGIPATYRELSRSGRAKLLLFDPQDDWRTGASGSEYSACDVVPVKAALAEVSGERVLHVTAAPGCSSLYAPNPEFLKRFPVGKWFSVTRTEIVRVATFAALQSELGIPSPDILKADVQGLELEVLKGFGPALDAVSFVELETCLEPIYVGQPTLPEVYVFMSRRGFVLRDLKPQGPFEGAAIEFNSYWSRSPKVMSPRQARIDALWRAVHGIWPGEFFADADRNARAATRFTDQ
jgi:FkbM family methyltransferase